MDRGEWKMTIWLEPVTETDTEVLTDILMKSFNSDTQYYFGDNEVGGPPGYDDGTIAQKLIKSENLISFMIYREDERVGCISINSYEREIAYFCVLPDYHQKGIGRTVWQQIESMYGTNEWLVETPDYSLKNHAFYEKLGFVKIGEKMYSPVAKSCVFEKIDKDKLTRDKVKKLIKQQPEFMSLLRIVSELQLNDGWIVAGTIRNYLWNSLLDNHVLDTSTDIDVAFYDVAVSYEKNREIEEHLKQVYPTYKWEVKNQIYMNGHNPNTSTYMSTRDAVYHYPEKCTAIAIRLNQGEIEVFCPYGLDDIEQFKVTPTPYVMRDKKRIKLYNDRQKTKKWQEKYPKLTINYEAMVK
ncbi:hypothetical protein CBF36_06780 [Vagococcus bubulae]|uniref:N-acetyltransferase domain-containing protein n=2 Tax=Vagococcus bubulae TaxID=1977868 RepID=A0A429ZK91_9ENTE|nr:hypothetical protein CBF36_06780 [Vagococcus bubulae]